MTFSWFPGHMAKARQAIKRSLAGIDVVIEVLDARIPRTSRNPEIEWIVGDRARVVVLAKEDLADPVETGRWLATLRSREPFCYAVNAETGEGIEAVVAACSSVAGQIMLRLAARGRRMRAVRAMVIGIPNVGKSSLVNRIAGRKSARTGARPGITRGNQWIAVGRGIELLDTPGVLWPRADDPGAMFKLAATGAVSDESFDLVDVAERLLEVLRESSPDGLASRLRSHDALAMGGRDLLELAGRKRGCLGPGGVVDTARAAAAVLSDFRKGLFGRVTLDPAPGEGDYA
ncbi:MAG: ribosome biogenesis GTPase YlqF [Firmicutes bacterium]|jgi:ribosome biogenesis GTPase A|nr:ribosome biogenesis GTPase YlqF [Bacillota bacterium]MDH7494920.1 ribosome biogenesis GTPase YlqF [Bacillota bacterium]